MTNDQVYKNMVRLMCEHCSTASQCADHDCMDFVIWYEVVSEYITVIQNVSLELGIIEPRQVHSFDRVCPARTKSIREQVDYNLRRFVKCPLCSKSPPCEEITCATFRHHKNLIVRYLG